MLALAPLAALADREVLYHFGEKEFVFMLSEKPCDNAGGLTLLMRGQDPDAARNGTVKGPEGYAAEMCYLTDLGGGTIIVGDENGNFGSVPLNEESKL